MIVNRIEGIRRKAYLLDVELKHLVHIHRNTCHYRILSPVIAALSDDDRPDGLRLHHLTKRSHFIQILQVTKSFSKTAINYYNVRAARIQRPGTTLLTGYGTYTLNGIGQSQGPM